MWWDSQDRLDLRVLQELRDTPDQEASKADGDFRVLLDLTESLVFQETQESPDLQASLVLLEATCCLRWLQGSMRRPFQPPWCQERGVKQDQEDLQEPLDLLVRLAVRGFQERLEILDRWESRVIEDLMGRLEKLDLMENLDLQELQENQDFQDLWVQEDFQDFRVIQV